MPLRRLWPVDKSHQGRDTPEGTAAHGRIHARAEKMSKKEGAMKEKSKKEGVAKKNLYRLTPASCAAHLITEGTECNLQQNKGRGH